MDFIESAFNFCIHLKFVADEQIKFRWNEVKTIRCLNIIQVLCLIRLSNNPFFIYHSLFPIKTALRYLFILNEPQKYIQPRLVCLFDFQAFCREPIFYFHIGWRNLVNEDAVLLISKKKENKKNSVHDLTNSNSDKNSAMENCNPQFGHNRQLNTWFEWKS